MRSLLSNILINFLEGTAQAPNTGNQKFDWTLALLIAIIVLLAFYFSSF